MSAEPKMGQAQRGTIKIDIFMIPRIAEEKGG